VLIWVPDQAYPDSTYWSFPSGRMCYIGKGWAGSTMAQDSVTAEVRVLAWRTLPGVCVCASVCVCVALLRDRVLLLLASISPDVSLSIVRA
jgi:hypothetical protein